MAPSAATRDWIIRTIRKQIDKWHVQSFEHFTAFDIRVYASDSGAENPYPSYTFDFWHFESRSMPVRLSSRRKVQVRCDKHWILLTQWLDHVKTFVVPKTRKGNKRDIYHQGLREHQMAKQAEWWDQNGKSFRFLNLPAEMREKIYHAVIPDRIEPYPSRSIRRMGWAAMGLRDPQQPAMQLLKTSKQIYLEGSKILHNRLFHVRYQRILAKLLRIEEQRNLITRLELALSHLDFVKAFPLRAPLAADRVRYLQTMGLQQLTITIAPPAEVTEDPIFDRACQKEVVDFLFERLWPWVRGLPVKVAGYVKDGQREAFEESCSAEHAKIGRWRDFMVTLGTKSSSVKDYYDWQEWLHEERDGGVCLGTGPAMPEQRPCSATKENSEDEDFDSESDSDSDDEEYFPCLCKPRCSLATWTNRDDEEESENE